jgi:hypothetical protein
MIPKGAASGIGLMPLAEWTMHRLLAPMLTVTQRLAEGRFAIPTGEDVSSWL